MNQMFYKTKIAPLSILLLMLMSVQGFGQNPRARMGAVNGMNGGRFYGKIVDGKTNKPIDGATIQLSKAVRDTATKEISEQVIALTITDKKGDFSIDKVSPMGKYNLIVTAVGYSAVLEEISFDIKRNGDRSQMMAALDKDLGNIKMHENVEELEGVVVTASKSMLQMNIDRKVFNVDKDISAAGGTAIDVMKNVPSVSVDIDGNVALRNKAPQILVDGRPTTLTLEQIPADQIESVEIITNPSAKFDASGGGAGILNLILKKNRKPGYNGSVRTNADTKAAYGFGGDLNVNQGKVNFFASGMFARRKSSTENTTIRTDQVNDLTAHFDQRGNTDLKGNFGFGRAGLDFLMDNRNTFTVSGLYMNGKFDNTGLMDIIRDSTINGYFLEENGIINTNNLIKFKNTGGTLGYKHNFAKPNKFITADVNYFAMQNSGNSLIKTQYYDNFSDWRPETRQLTLTNGKTKTLIAQTDYTNPINENVKIEAGLRAAVRNYNSANENFMYDNNEKDYKPLTLLNSKFKYNDQVYAGYLTYSQKINNFSFQLGGRIESSFYSGELVDSNQTFSNQFPFSFFPSVFLTQKIDDKQDIQLNYSRKINRPNFFQLIPYYDFTDSLNISKGNPALKPEFTNLVELSYQYNMGKGNNLLATVYYRNTNDLITRFTFRDVSPNHAPDSIFISSFTNASKSDAYGLEVTSLNRIVKWWSITTNVNVYNSVINGSNLDIGLKNNQVSWFGKINNTFTLPYSFSVQLTGDYTSKIILPPARGGGGGGGMHGAPVSTANGYSEPTWGFDLAIKKDFLKDRSASVSLSMSDIFATRVFKTHSRSDFSKDIWSVQENERFRDPQVVRLNLSWRFGKMDASLFKRKNMKAEQEGMREGMQGMQ